MTLASICFICSTCLLCAAVCALAYHLRTLVRDNAELRAQNERFIAALSHTYPAIPARPSDLLPDPPPTPSGSYFHYPRQSR